jgi:alkylated DNA repair dioxygenase AlkB
MEKVLKTPTEKGALWVGKIPDGMLKEYKDKIMGLELQHKPLIVVYGKECHQNRDVQFFSNESKGYAYSGKLAASKPLTKELTEILSWVNNLFGVGCNGVLVNRYNDGNDCIGAHSDDEKSLGKNGVVGIVFGATRKFRIRTKDATNKIVKDVPMEDGTVYWMSGIKATPRLNSTLVFATILVLELNKTQMKQFDTLSWLWSKETRMLSLSLK